MLSFIKRHLHKSILTVILIMGITFLTAPKKEADAFGGCICCCLCYPIAYAASLAVLEAAHAGTRSAFSIRMGLHEDFMEDIFFGEALMPAWQNMTEQLVSNMMHQMFIIGTFFDAKIQLDTQRLLQRKMAEAHKDYHPSIGMCEFTTNARSLAASKMNAQLTTQAISKQLEDTPLERTPF